jgi:hypothetical protein
VFMPEEIAWSIASRQWNAAPLRTLARSQSVFILLIPLDLQTYLAHRLQKMTAASTPTNMTVDLQFGQINKVETMSRKAKFVSFSGIVVVEPDLHDDTPDIHPKVELRPS